MKNKPRNSGHHLQTYRELLSGHHPLRVAELAEFQLPNGSISLQDERWKCPEALFNPSLVGLEPWRLADSLRS